jgi:hypothetical protein
MASPSNSTPSLKLLDWPIEQLPGLIRENQQNLHHCGIATTQTLIRKTRTDRQQQQIANQLKIAVRDVQKWGIMAQLACLPSVGSRYCGLLLHAGVSSIAQLATLPAARVHQQVLRIQVATMQRRDLCPPVDEVARWIQEARMLVNAQQKARGER